MPKLEVWIEYASTYSYLTVMRIGKLADAQGVSLEWHPFLLAPVRNEQVLGHPFPDNSPRTAYMWRDLERRAARYGLPYRRPESYPVNSMRTARVATLAAEQGWCREFTERVFQLHWVEGQMIGTDQNLASALRSLGRVPDATIERAESSEVKNALKAQTPLALQRGVFGSPSFVANGELFWGDDRLEDAFDWLRTTGRSP